MLDYKDWITERISYDDILVTKDVLNMMVNKIYKYVKITPELEFDYHISTFKEMFYKMIYQKYYIGKRSVYIPYIPYDEFMYEYFSMKFSDDIIDIHFFCKELAKQYNLDIFVKVDCSLYLVDFIFDTVLTADPYYDDGDDGLSEEENIDYSIDG